MCYIVHLTALKIHKNQPGFVYKKSPRYFLFILLQCLLWLYIQSLAMLLDQYMYWFLTRVNKSHMNVHSKFLFLFVIGKKVLKNGTQDSLKDNCCVNYLNGISGCNKKTAIDRNNFHIEFKLYSMLILLEERKNHKPSII